MSTITIGWLNKCRCGNKSHTVKTVRGNEISLLDDDAVKCNSCGRGGVIQVCEGQARVLWETDEEMAEVKPMSTFTKEQLITQAQENVAQWHDAMQHNVNTEYAAIRLRLAEIALASLEAQTEDSSDLGAVKFEYTGAGDYYGYGFYRDGVQVDVDITKPLYTVPPAPVSVPAEVGWEDVPEDITEDDMEVALAWAHGFNQCRAAMLQSFGNSEQLEHVTTTNKLPFEQWLSQQDEPIDVDCGCVTTEAFYHWLRVAYEVGNSPVIPEGYVLVPKEPTEEMNKAGWAAMNEHDAINPTYRAMLAAAPQQEVKP